MQSGILVSVPLRGFVVSNIMKENLFKLAAEVSVPLRGFVVSNAKEVIMFKMKKNVSVPLRGFVVSNSHYAKRLC